MIDADNKIKLVKPKLSFLGSFVLLSLIFGSTNQHLLVVSELTGAFANHFGF